MKTKSNKNQTADKTDRLSFLPHCVYYSVIYSDVALVFGLDTIQGDINLIPGIFSSYILDI